MSRGSLGSGALRSVSIALALGTLAITGLGAVAGVRGPGLLLPLLGALAALGATLGVLGRLRADLLALGTAQASELATRTPATREGRALAAAAMLLHARGAELRESEQRISREHERADQLRMRFVAAMGHDLRGPLNAILGFSELLGLEGDNGVTTAQRPAIEHIRQSANDLLSLLDNMLDWARMESGLLALEPTELALEEVLALVQERALARSGTRGLRLDIERDGVRTTLQADRQRLAQALLGLLDYALRGPNAHVTLRVESELDGPGGPRVRLLLCDRALRIRNEDHGTFFEAFRPSHEPSGKRLGGMGIGPSVARALIRAHGGDVWFESDALEGTTFAVELPVSPSTGSW